MNEQTKKEQRNTSEEKKEEEIMIRRTGCQNRNRQRATIAWNVGDEIAWVEKRKEIQASKLYLHFISNFHFVHRVFLFFFFLF